MTQHLIALAKGQVLNYAVALARGAKPEDIVARPHGHTAGRRVWLPGLISAWMPFNPAYYADHGHKLIEEHGITTRCDLKRADRLWEAYFWQPSMSYSMTGKTALIAACRTFAVSRLGIHVEVPENFTNED